MRWIVGSWVIHMLTPITCPGITIGSRCRAELSDVAGSATSTNERRHVQGCAYSALLLATCALRLAAELLDCAVAQALWHRNPRRGRPIVLGSERAGGTTRQSTTFSSLSNETRVTGAGRNISVSVPKQF
eukprot:COSAG02_NODE_708_length_18231_cov_53.208416_9_plen_130_part_00